MTSTDRLAESLAVAKEYRAAMRPFRVAMRAALADLSDWVLQESNGLSLRAGQELRPIAHEFGLELGSIDWRTKAGKLYREKAEGIELEYQRKQCALRDTYAIRRDSIRKSYQEQLDKVAATFNGN